MQGKAKDAGGLTQYHPIGSAEARSFGPRLAPAKDDNAAMQSRAAELFAVFSWFAIMPG